MPWRSPSAVPTRLPPPCVDAPNARGSCQVLPGNLFRDVVVTPESSCSVAHIEASVSLVDNFVARARAKGVYSERARTRNSLRGGMAWRTAMSHDGSSWRQWVLRE